MENKEKFMKMALREAQKAFDKDEVPIGAIIVKNDKIIAKAHNLRESKKRATAHAEILAIEKACRKLDAWRLDGCDMYITLEPCPMCVGAILNARIRNVYIGAMETRSGAAGSKINIFEEYNFNHTVNYETGIMQEQCAEILKTFFKKIRDKKTNIDKK